MATIPEILIIEINKFQLHLLKHLEGESEEMLLHSYSRITDEVEDLMEMVSVGPIMWSSVLLALNLSG